MRDGHRHRRRRLRRPGRLRAARARVARAVTFEAVVFDLFGTLVPEFSKKDFFQQRARDGGRAGRRPRPVRGGMDRYRARTPDRRVRDGRGQRAPHLRVAGRRSGRRRAGRGAGASPRPVPDVVLPAPRGARDADGAEGARLSDRADQHVRAGRARDVAHVGARAVRRRRGLLQRDRVAQAGCRDLSARDRRTRGRSRGVRVLRRRRVRRAGRRAGGGDDVVPDRRPRRRRGGVAHARA